MRNVFAIAVMSLALVSFAGCKGKWPEHEKLCLDKKDAPKAKRLNICRAVCGAKDRYKSKISRGDAACKMAKKLEATCFASTKPDVGVCDYLCDKLDKKACARAKLIKSGAIK